VTRYDAVLFDLDGTLCTHLQDADALYRQAFERAGVDRFGAPADLWTALDGPPGADELSHLSEGFRRLTARYGREQVDSEALARGFLDAVDYSAVAFRPGAPAALRRARDVGPVGLVTNGPSARQSVKLDALDVADAFDVCVFAADTPPQKPDPAPFVRALDALDVDASRALYVGNSLEYDVVGAQRAGLHVAWYPEADDASADGYDPEFVFRTLADLDGVL
jgi:putative hydrolase of the HAD superfamily